MTRLDTLRLVIKQALQAASQEGRITQSHPRTILLMSRADFEAIRNWGGQ